MSDHTLTMSVAPEYLEKNPSKMSLMDLPTLELI